MVEIYNLSQFSDNTGIIGFWQTMSTLSKYYFGGFLVIIMFVIPAIAMMRSGRDQLESILYSSLMSGLLAIFLYLGEIIINTAYIYIPAIIFVSTVAIRWYHSN